MGGPIKTTKFNQQWLEDKIFSVWLKEVPGKPYSARCDWCTATFSLSNMGRRAVLSHAESKKHKNIMTTRRKTHDIGISLAGARSGILDVTNRTVIGSQGVSTPSNTKADTATSQDILGISGPTSRGMTSFLIAENVTRTEILWCLHTIETHNSLRAAAKAITLFPIMFPDSQIALKLRMQRTKLAYVLVHGLAPYFHNELILLLQNCTDVVVGFDESLNKIAQLGQMDVFVRFWRQDTNQVATRYFKSAFLNHATAADLLRAFTSALSDIDLKTLLQISMDGPNVNLKFHRELSTSLASDPNDRLLVEIGSCGLHNVNGAFKAGMKATAWEVSEFLTGLYYTFKDSPARRGDYTYYSGSKIFPQKFCTIRWLENTTVAERAIAIVPNVKKYIEGITRDKKTIPQSKSFKTVQAALKDKLLICKLSFFQSVAAEVEPFLTEFQTDKPIAPLLFESLSKMLKNLMSRFIKPEILTGAKSVQSVDVSEKKNLLDSKRIDLGYATREAISKARDLLSDRDIVEFRHQCRAGLQRVCEKLQNRSPLTFALTKGISCLDPVVAIMHTLRDARLRIALNALIKSQQISGTVADKVEKQFKEVCGKSMFLDIMKNFSRKDDRLDDLWISVVKDATDVLQELTAFLKKILILSHGNADLERGFSVNRECLVENQHEESLIAQRQVYDALYAAGGVEMLNITKPMIHAARNAHCRYIECMEQKKKQNATEETINAEKKARALELKQLEEKKRTIIASAKEEEAALDEKIKALKKTM